MHFSNFSGISTFTKIPIPVGTPVPRTDSIRTITERLAEEMGERLEPMGLAPLGQFAGESAELVTSAIS
jgi:hypothetical protein